MAVLGKSNLIQSESIVCGEATVVRQAVRQLIIGQIKAIDILQDQQALGIDDHDGWESQAAMLLLRHDPEEAGGEEKHKRQPTVICDTPDLYISK